MKDRYHHLAARPIRILLGQPGMVGRFGTILGKAGASGDDPLGIYHSTLGERVKGWGKMGALWGGLWGLLTGATGMFLIPGLGPVLAAGTIVEALAGALTGATLTGGVMAGAAALSHLAVAMHRMGVPEERLAALHEAVERGEYVVMLRLPPQELEHWQAIASFCGARETLSFPYHGLLPHH